MPTVFFQVFFLGKLSGANRTEAAEVVRQSGGTVAKKLNDQVELIVVGDDNILKQNWNFWNDQLDADTRDAFEKSKLSIISETQFWEQYAPHIASQTPQPNTEASQTLYTPSVLAGLTGLPTAVIRRLHRERLILPVRQIYRLCYFDKEVMLPLKIMQNMLASGISIHTAFKHFRKFIRHKPVYLADVRIDGKDIIFTSDDVNIDQNGQQRFCFASDENDTEYEWMQPAETADPLAILDSILMPEPMQSGLMPINPAVLCKAAGELETLGNLQGAADLYRAALAAGGADPIINFQLAEVLYRQGDLSAACERYYSAIELDENFIEARANLGCVLAELGHRDLAESAFRGALKLHPDYAEVRLHLARLLKQNTEPGG